MDKSARRAREAGGLLGCVTSQEAGRARPLTRLATLAVAGHVYFELAAGVGLPVASFVGPVPAALAFAATARAAWRRAGNPSGVVDTRLAFWNGLILAASVAHLTAWPSRRSKQGLPLLVDCEGLGPELMPAYNLLIYAGGGSAALALALENRSGDRRPALAAISAIPLLVVVQQVEHRRLREQARRRPGWWNRRLQPAA